VYIEQNRFYCFSCKKSGDSLDLLAYATGKPLFDILHERGVIVPSNEITQHKRNMEGQKHFTEQVYSCWLRLAKIHRDTYTLENKCNSIPTDDKLSLLADAFFMRKITSQLLDKLESKNSAEVKQGLNEAQRRGLFSG
jgi:hypothetical protein